MTHGQMGWSSLTSSREDGDSTLKELRDAWRLSSPTGSPDVVQEGPTWRATWWWDLVPSALRVRIVGNVDDANRGIAEAAKGLPVTLRSRVTDAIAEEVARRVAMGWSPGVPGQKKSRKKADVREPEVAVPSGRRLRFEDKIDIKPARKSRRRT